MDELDATTSLGIISFTNTSTVIFPSTLLDTLSNREKAVQNIIQIKPNSNEEADLATAVELAASVSLKKYFST